MSTEKRKFNIIKIVAYAAFLAMVIINILADTIPFGGATIAQIARRYDNLFNPADYTFAIWGVIYFGLAVYLIYQSGLLKGLDLYPKIGEHVIAKINTNFILAAAAVIIWIFAWHYDLILLSTIAMILLLIFLIIIAVTIFRGHIGLYDYIFIKAPFSLFFGWVTIATIANITTLFVSLGWNGFGIGEQVWTIIVLIIGLIIGLFVILRLRDIAYGIVYHWAYIGILVRHFRELNGAYTGVIITLFISLALLFAAVLYLIIKAIQDKDKVRDAVKDNVTVKDKKAERK